MPSNAQHQENEYGGGGEHARTDEALEGVVVFEVAADIEGERLGESSDVARDDENRTVFAKYPGGGE